MKHCVRINKTIWSGKMEKEIDLSKSGVLSNQKLFGFTQTDRTKIYC